MRKKLARDYFERGIKRRKMLDVLMEEKDYADVIRESQEIVELILKGLLLYYGIEAPKVHDVGIILEKNEDIFPEFLKEKIPSIAKVSRELRKDRELAFYGAEDIIPLEYYQKEDADKAISYVDEIILLLKKIFNV
ncbi:MAG: HEPN domain-containing protein [Dictyoglomaceae bacterium]|nr:HEPN domain-containing protein [Dictyoglomaceae bacterium]